MTELPTISVVIPMYNSAATVLAALESVAGQTLPPSQIVVVDDGSTDESAALVEQFLRREGHIPSLLLRQSNQGPGAARDTGVKNARGDYVALLDADDTWMPDKLSVCAQAIAQHKLDLIGAPVRSACRAEDPFRLISPQAMLFTNPYFTSTVILSRAAYAIAGGFHRTQRYSEDYALWLEFAWRHLRCGWMSDAHAAYRPGNRHSHRGLSSHLWRMQRAEIGNFTALCRRGVLPVHWFAAATAVSWLKFLRRLAQRLWSGAHAV